MGAARRRVARLALALAATGAVALTGPGQVAPAVAGTTTTTVSVHVQDSGGTALRGVLVVADGIDRERYVYLGRTDADGNLTRVTGQKGTIRPGTWRFGYIDTSTARIEAGTRMVPTSYDVRVRAGYNRLPRVTMTLGETIRGTVTAPSGAPIVNYYLEADPADPSDETGYYGGAYALTGTDGRYVMSGLEPGRYVVYQEIDEETDEGGGTPIDVPAGGTTYDVRDRVLQARDLTLSGVASGPGAVTLTYGISDYRYGGTDPGGSVSIVVDGDRTHPVTAPVEAGDDGGTAVVTISGLAPGTHTFTAAYTGTDLRAKRIGISKTVR